MAMSTSEQMVDTRRLPVSVDGSVGRVACWRLGPVVLDRCRECVYLLRLEGTSARDSAAAYVVCSGHHPEPELDFAW